VHGADRRGELARRRVLEQEPAGAVLERAAQVAGPAEGGEDQRAAVTTSA
jgi:hypothetical protein